VRLDGIRGGLTDAELEKFIKIPVEMIWRARAAGS
jgi:hypothetical protein